MKQYNLTLSVPDDFNPEELSIDLGYKDDVEIVAEGFEPYFDPELLNKVAIRKEELDEHSVIVFTFGKDILEDPNAGLQMNALRTFLESYLNVPAIGYADDITLLVENADQAISMFSSMIAKIKTRTAVKDTSGIVLPK